MGYSFFASVLPVWLLLAPRDYLSAFVKIGVVLALALGIVIVLPPLQMPALTQFTDGTGPVFAGKIFPFAFITIACGSTLRYSAMAAAVARATLQLEDLAERHAHVVGGGVVEGDRSPQLQDALFVPALLRVELAELVNTRAA